MPFLTVTECQGKMLVGDHNKVIWGKRTDFMKFVAGSHRPKFTPSLTIGNTSANGATLVHLSLEAKDMIL